MESVWLKEEDKLDMEKKTSTIEKTIPAIQMIGKSQGDCFNRNRKEIARIVSTEIARKSQGLFQQKSQGNRKEIVSTEARSGAEYQIADRYWFVV